jgi:hypothetical protein
VASHARDDLSAWHSSANGTRVAAHKFRRRDLVASRPISAGLCNVIYHARDAFTDDAATGQVRRLFRLWLVVPNSRALPEDHAVLWGDVRAGAVRGGIAVAGE